MYYEYNIYYSTIQFTFEFKIWSFWYEYKKVGIYPKNFRTI